LLLAAYSGYALHCWDCCLRFSTQTSSAACVNNHN
jgi:hypothetical protein